MKENLAVMPELAPSPPSERGEARRVVRRIAYILSFFPCYDETFILREMKGLVERGVDLRIFSLRRKRHPVLQEDARPFLPATRYAAYVSGEVVGACLRALRRRPLVMVGITGAIFRGCWRRPLILLRSLAMLPKSVLFAEVAVREGINHVHAHWATYPATAAWVTSRLTGIPWSFTCHAHDIFLNPSLLSEKLEAADFVLTCTADNKRHLETVNPMARRKVRVSYHGLDLRRFRPSGLRPGEAEVEILAVGSLLACKGFDILVDACGILKRRGLSFRVTVAGGGPEEGRLREAIARQGLGNRVRLTGYVTQASLVPLYQAADLFVLPAVLEIHWGIPNVLVEAMACAVPVITTALPSLPELVEDGVQGLVAANRDATDLAEKMALLIQDPERRRAMGRAGRERVESRFDIERTIETVLQPLREGTLGES
jgi:colanic acid/amylovoran biosynthesis glycosyltransferase